MARAAKLKVFLAGRVAIECGDVVVGERRFPGRQGRLLFAYLVAEQGRPVPRDELADALWVDAPPATWEKALTVLVSKLRGLLTECGVDGATALTSAFGCYRLELSEGTWVDVTAAADLVAEAEAALAAGDLDRARAVAEEGASLARPLFLSGEQGDWVEAKRRELSDILVRALSCLTEASFRSGDSAGAANWAEETIALEPYRETGYRHLMAAHAAAGNRAEALRVYERCRQLLATELGAYPSPETESIYRELLEAPSLEPGAAAAPETAPVAVVEHETLRAKSSAPKAPPGSRWRYRVVLGALAGMIAAVAILLFALRGGADRRDLGDRSNSVGVLDGGSGAVKDAVELPATPTAVAAGLGYVWAVSTDSDAVYAINPETNTVYDKIEVGNAPGGIAVGDGYVWVTNSLTGTVSKIDPDALSGFCRRLPIPYGTCAVVQSITVGSGPSGVAVRGGHVWVANTLDRTVSEIRANDGKLLETYPAGTDAGAVAIDEGAIWVASKSSGTVVKLNPRSGQPLKKIPVGQGPAAIAVGFGSVWVTSSVDGTVAQIDPVSERVVDVETVGANPSGLGIVGEEVWTTNEGAGTISRIDPARLRRSTTIDVGGRPSALASGGGTVYVAVRSNARDAVDRAARGLREEDTIAHRGGTLTVAFECCRSRPALETLDLADGSLNSLWRFPALTNDGLLAYRQVAGQAGNQLVPDLARAMPNISADRKTYRFHLRPNIRYSNGRPVRASDFRYGIERALKLQWRTGHNFNSSIVKYTFRSIRGADRCHLHRCNLAAGIVADDVDRTLSFHLSASDPYFLYKLASTLAAPVPAGTSLQEATRRPLPATGPYRIISFTGNAVRLARNPYFQEWSETAQPDGVPDEIVLKIVSAQTQIALVEQGKADLASNFLLEEFSDAPKFRAQIRWHPLAGTAYLALDTSRPPFDDARARRALNYAVDRNTIAQLATEGSRPTCQVLPPNFPGYRRHCPYTLSSSDGAWTAPDLDRAARLIEESGTAGETVTLWVDRRYFGNRVGRYLKQFLESLRYRPQLRESFPDPGTPADYFTQLQRGARSHHSGPHVAFAFAGAAYPAPSSFFREPFRCRSKFNYGGFCDPALDQRISRAVELEETDRVGANRLWTQLDREITDKALWVPLFNGYQADLVSKRVGNYQYSPQSGPLLSQMWVR
jgi:peptide/nickel transport system substrate-binding protein